MTIDAPFIWEHPGDLRFSSSIDESGLLFWWCGDGHGDNEDIDALEGFDKGCKVGIIDFGKFDASRSFVATFGAGDGGDVMVSCLE